MHPSGLFLAYYYGDKPKDKNEVPEALRDIFGKKYNNNNNNDGNEVRNIRNRQDEGHEYVSGRFSLSWEPTDNLSIKFKYQNIMSIYPARKLIRFI